MTDEEWGPWIEHDGKGCPVSVGTWVLAQGSLGAQQEGRVSYLGLHRETSQWFGPRTDKYDHIIRYRIRKPRGMKVLEELMQNLPGDVDA